MLASGGLSPAKWISTQQVTSSGPACSGATWRSLEGIDGDAFKIPVK
jgi:hypothetical protein